MLMLHYAYTHLAHFKEGLFGGKGLGKPDYEGNVTETIEICI